MKNKLTLVFLLGFLYIACSNIYAQTPPPPGDQPPGGITPDIYDTIPSPGDQPPGTITSYVDSLSIFRASLLNFVRLGMYNEALSGAAGEVLSGQPDEVINEVISIVLSRVSSEALSEAFSGMPGEALNELFSKGPNAAPSAMLSEELSGAVSKILGGTSGEVVSAALSQVTDENVSIQKLTFKSPEAKAFERYGEIPVDIYTGVPNISIPIYTVRSGDVKLPVTLDYQATAIQVDQEATWVGLNWLMNAGGVITTQVVPTSEDNAMLTDADWNGLYQASYLHEYTINDLMQSYKINGCHEMNWRGDYGYNAFMCSNSTNDINREIYNKLLYLNEGEAPLYFANFMGYSFKFIYDRYKKKFVIVGKDQKFRIDFATKLIAPDGTEYYFNEMETILPTNPQKMAYLPRSVSYYLTKVVSPTGRTINLTYKRYGTISLLQHVTETVYDGYPSKSGSFVDRTLSDYVAINNPYLYEITSDDAIVRFNVGTRTDLKGDGRKLDDISIYNKSTGKLIKRFKFTYSYFTGNGVGGNRLYDYFQSLPNGVANYNALYSSNMINTRLRLETLQEESIDDNNLSKTLPAYQFGYTSFSLPAKTSSACDYWGNYNGKENSYSDAKFPHTLLVASSRTGEDIINGCAGSQFPPGSYADRRFNPGTVDIGLLSSIKYPTGGSTSFSYEPNQFTNFNYFDVNTTANPVFTSLNTQNTQVNSTIPPEYTSPKEFTLTQEMELEFSITVNKPSHYSWRSIYGAQGQLFGYTMFSNPNGPPYEVPYMYKNWAFSDSTDLAGQTSKNWTEKIILPPGKYKIQAEIPFPQIQIYPNFLGGCAVYMSVSQPAAPVRISKGCGVRIKSITQYDNGNQMITEYRYKTEDGYPTGILMSPLKFAREKMLLYQSNTDATPGTAIFPPSEIKYWLLSSDNMIPVTENKIGYSRVEVIKKLSSNSSENNGKTVYEFFNRRNSSPSEYFKPLDDPRNGNLLKESVYNSSGQLARETENVFTVLNKENYYLNAVMEDIYLGGDVCGGSGQVNVNPYAYGGSGRVMLYIYPSSKFWIELTKKTEKLYSYPGNSLITNTTDYTYNPLNLALASVQKSVNTNDSEITYYVYPQDYTLTNNVYPSALVDKNILLSPMEIVSCRNKSNNVTVSSGIINKYDNNGQVITNYRLNTDVPIALSGFKFSNKSANGVLGTSAGSMTTYTPFSKYEPRVTCTYMTNGNLSTFNKDNAENIVYLWGYASQYPIAEIRNATQTEVNAVLSSVFGVTTTDALATAATPPNEIKLKDGSLQKALPNALVTTYTYKQLFGMMTATAPNGTVTYYDYDPFGRLKETYIMDGSIKKTLQTYTYQYQNQ